jgi:hypothetical protein
VRTDNVNASVAVMTGSLNRARNRRILVQGSMRSDAVVIISIGFQNSAQMRLAQDNDGSPTPAGACQATWDFRHKGSILAGGGYANTIKADALSPSGQPAILLGSKRVPIRCISKRQIRIACKREDNFRVIKYLICHL